VCSSDLISRKLFILARILAGRTKRIERPRRPLPRVFLMISNHQSLADIPALAFAFPRHALISRTVHRAAVKAKKTHPERMGGNAAAVQALKSLGLRSWRWHLSHSAVLRSFPCVKTSFIFTSPPQVQKNFCVTIPTLAFLLKTSAMFT
jgi:hypothetical protein